MLKKFQNSITFLMRIVVFAICAGCFFVIFGLRFPFLLRPSRTSAITLLSFSIVYVLMTMVYGGYDIGTRKSKPIIFSLSLSVFFADLVAHLFLCIMNFTLVNDKRFVYESPLRLIAVFVLQLIIIIGSAYLGNHLYFCANEPEKCLVITHRGENVQSIMQKVGRFKRQFAISDIAYTDQADIFELIDSADAVFICSLAVSERTPFVEYCYQHQKNIYYSIEMADIVALGGRRVTFDDQSMIYSPVKGLTFEQRIIKRAMDIAIASVGLVLVSPIMLITAIAIKLEDGGPVFYRQERATYAGRVFEVIKFRSMGVKDGKIHRSVTKNDRRITKVGRIIRKFRIDELPQLINVLKSDMSIVGPRPEMMENVKKYTKELPEFSYRLRAKAGITGMAQIYGKYNTSPKDKLIFDLAYIEQYSILLDIKLILRTILVLLTPEESTEAFDSTKETK